MKFRWLLSFPALLASLIPSAASLAAPAESSPQPERAATCPQSPALSRFTRHQIASGETIESIAQKYDLIPATLMGLNPVLQGGTAPAGTEIVIPPYNGIRVQVPSGQTLQDIAAAYNVRPDVLFEVNGCQQNPTVVFVPGVNWSPGRPNVQALNKLSGSPLPKVTTVLTGYGWQLNPLTSQVTFNSGVDLQAAAGTPVLSVGEGIVAFAGDRESYGNLVVVNHAGGRQTRYAHLGSVAVKTGQKVQLGDKLGTVGSTGTPTVKEPHLHFEVRYNSPLGWVAEDPALYVQSLENAQRF